MRSGGIRYGIVGIVALILAAYVGTVMVYAQSDTEIGRAHV